MVDWKQDVKLSGLLPGKSKGPASESRADAEPEPEKAKSERKPLLKRELSFKRKAKEPRPKSAGKARSGSSHKRVKRLVGLKIGASQLAAAKVVNNGVPELVQVARVDLDPGLVVSGELREPELLADALRAFFRDNGLPRQGVRLGIANNRIGVRIFEIAGISDPQQLENAVRFRAQEVLPIPLEEAVLDFQVLGRRTDDDGNPVTRILLVVAYRELLDRYVAAC